MKKVFSILLSLIMAVAVIQPYATLALSYDKTDFEGPNDSEHSYLDIRIGGERYTLYHRGMCSDNVSLDGVCYDRDENTLTLENFNRQDARLEMSEMGNDFKINVVGENYVQSIFANADKYMNSVIIVGDGSLYVNKDKTSESVPVVLYAENTYSIIEIQDTVRFSVFADEDLDTVLVDNSLSDTPIICGNSDYRISEIENSYNRPVTTRGLETQSNQLYKIKGSDSYATYVYDEFSQETVLCEFKIFVRNIDGKDVNIAEPVVDDMGNQVPVEIENVDFISMVEACQLLFGSDKPVYTKENDENEYSVEEIFTSSDENPGELVQIWNVYKVINDEEVGNIFYPVATDLTQQPTEYTPVTETVHSRQTYITDSFSNFKDESLEYNLTAKVQGRDGEYNDGDTVFIEKGGSALISFDVTDTEGNEYVAVWYSEDMADAGFLIEDEPVIENGVKYALIRNNAEAGASGTLIINAYSEEKFNSEDFDWNTTPADATLCLFIGSVSSASCNHLWEDATCTRPKTCSLCGATVGSALGHDLVKVADAVNPTCFSVGWTAGYKCSRCDYEVRQEEVAKIAHAYDSGVVTKKPTCTATGIKTYTCKICKATKTETVAKIAHSYKTTTVKATTGKSGYVLTKCAVCGSVKSKSTIYYPKTISLSTASYTYDGKVKTPSVTVKDSKGKTLKRNTDYTVTYSSGRKYVGKYAVKVTFKGNYSGSKILYFTVKPRATSISSLAAGSKSFSVKWRKQTSQITGYQVQYSTSSKFTKAKTYTFSSKTTSKKVTRLSGKKKYYVRVRTYKRVGKTNYFSSWSGAKAVVTKR